MAYFGADASAGSTRPQTRRGLHHLGMSQQAAAGLAPDTQRLVFCLDVEMANPEASTWDRPTILALAVAVVAITPGCAPGCCKRVRILSCMRWNLFSPAFTVFSHGTLASFWANKREMLAAMRAPVHVDAARAAFDAHQRAAAQEFLDMREAWVAAAARAGVGLDLVTDCPGADVKHVDAWLAAFSVTRSVRRDVSSAPALRACPKPEPITPRLMCLPYRAPPTAIPPAGVSGLAAQPTAEIDSAAVPPAPAPDTSDACDWFEFTAAEGGGGSGGGQRGHAHAHTRHHYARHPVVGMKVACSPVVHESVMHMPCGEHAAGGPRFQHITDVNTARQTVVAMLSGSARRQAGCGAKLARLLSFPPPNPKYSHEPDADAKCSGVSMCVVWLVQEAVHLWGLDTVMRAFERGTKLPCLNARAVRLTRAATRRGPHGGAAEEAR